jgi:DNA-binding IclR family transcriptional regulator
MKDTKYFTINSIVKTFKIMESLVSRSEWDLAELTNQTGIQKTTVHRMLLTLQSLGYVEQNPKNKRYSGSIKIFELGCKVISHLDYIKVARQHLIELAEKTKETVNLSVPDKLEMIVIERIESEHTLKQDTRLGDRFISYCSAGGKAVLANMEKAERKKLFAGHLLDSCSSKSIKTLEELERELEITVSRGYAVDNEEFLVGLRCVGAPVFNHNNKVIAGLSVSAPTVRLKMGDIPELAKRVIKTAKNISRKIGATKAF